MIKVKYNIDSDILCKRYLDIFDLSVMKPIWMPFEGIFGMTLEELLTAQFDRLVDVYYQYKVTKLSEEQISTLTALFDYDQYQPKLAWFFMNPDNKFNFSTCHYCNAAYINSYGKGNSYSNVLEAVNSFTPADWRYWFTEEQLSNKSINQIQREQPYSSLSEFNKKKYLYKRVELYKCMNLASDANHFDLDHVLPKKKCPITALSLYNFAPSCQVCNEKLKKDEELGRTKEEWLKTSPTYSGNCFDEDVTIKLRPEVSCSTFFELMGNRENYHLEFDTPHSAYENYVTLFRLRDRYNYHRQLALQILDLRERYSEEKVKEISRLLSKKYGEEGCAVYSEEQIMEDIFYMDFSKDRCFSKLRKDMMERN